MINCPNCRADNIEGVDTCETCGQSLADMHLAAPATAVERALLADRLKDLDPKTPVVVDLETTVNEALKLLVEKHIGCVFVVEDEKVVGVFSERDALIRLNVDFTKLGDRPIAEFMTPRPQSLDGSARVVYAVRLMDQGGYRHVPITNDEGGPTGVISVRDILAYLTEKMTGAEA